MPLYAQRPARPGQARSRAGTCEHMAPHCRARGGLAGSVKAVRLRSSTSERPAVGVTRGYAAEGEGRVG